MVALAVLVGLFALVGLTVGFGGSDEGEEPAGGANETAAVESVSPASTERWLLSSAKSDLYTVEVAPQGSGSVRVLEDATVDGTYAWSGDTLTIDFTRVLTMADDFTFKDPWVFVCTVSSGGETMSCDCTATQWEYSPDTGLDPGEPYTFPVTATRQ